MGPRLPTVRESPTSVTEVVVDVAAPLVTEEGVEGGVVSTLNSQLSTLHTNRQYMLLNATRLHQKNKYMLLNINTITNWVVTQFGLLENGPKLNQSISSAVRAIGP